MARNKINFGCSGLHDEPLEGFVNCVCELISMLVSGPREVSFIGCF